MSEKIKEMFAQPVYERAILSYCFKSIDNFYEIVSKVNEEDFLRPEHKLLYVLLKTLSKGNIAKFDMSMVINEAQKNGVLQQIGSYDYVNAIVQLELDEDNLPHYIDRVLDNSTKYQLHCKLESNLTALQRDARDDKVTSMDLLGKAGNDVMALSMKSKAVREARNLADGIEEYIEERRNTPIKFCGMSTGFEILDKRIDGLIPGTLHVVCARPKHGKSTFLSRVASYVAYDLSKPVLYIDTEMPFEQWRPRIIAMLSGVPERIVKHGGYSDQHYVNIKEAERIIKGGKLYHEYMPGYSVDKLSAIYKKYKHIDNIELAVFDYIKAPPGADFSNKKEYQLLGDVTTMLKDLAGELDIPFFAANQINRQQDIADSDRILRYADVLMFLKPKTVEEVEKFGIDYGTYRLIITDSRRGGTTPPEGIDYQFAKKCLRLNESIKQTINYDDREYQEQEEVDYGFNNIASKEGGTDDPTEGKDLF